MRRLLVSAMMFGAVSGAQAADMPDFLRGSILPPTTQRVNWQGYYIGGQGGYGSSDENFASTANSTGRMATALLASAPLLTQSVASLPNLAFGKFSSRASGYGAFAGYNSQWEDVVLGVEMSYLHGRFGGSMAASQRSTSVVALSDGFIHDVTTSATTAISISDFATFRVRGAYAFGCFLPYLFGGFALGNADISQTVSIQDVLRGVAALPLLTATDAVHNHLIYGYTAGLGFDVNLTGGLFLRAEWEYIRFTSTVDTSINTVRAGLGYKF